MCLGKIVTEAVVRYTASVFLWRRRRRSGRGEVKEWQRWRIFRRLCSDFVFKADAECGCVFPEQTEGGQGLPSERDANGGIFENRSEVWDRPWGDC